MKSIEERLAEALARVSTMTKQELLNTRENARRHGDAAAELIAAIDAKLLEFSASGSIAAARMEFARCMLRMVERAGAGQWIASRDLFLRAKVEHADNLYAQWMEGNGARQIPLTKALEDVRHEFPKLEKRKDGIEQSARVFYRLKP